MNVRRCINQCNHRKIICAQIVKQCNNGKYTTHSSASGAPGLAQYYNVKYTKNECTQNNHNKHNTPVPHKSLHWGLNEMADIIIDYITII